MKIKMFTSSCYRPPKLELGLGKGLGTGIGVTLKVIYSKILLCNWSILSLIMINFNYNFIQPAPEPIAKTPGTRLPLNQLKMLGRFEQKKTVTKQSQNFFFWGGGCGQSSQKNCERSTTF